MKFECKKHGVYVCAGKNEQLYSGVLILIAWGESDGAV